MLLVAVGCWKLLSEWCFSLFDGDELLEEASIVAVFFEDLLVVCSNVFSVKNLAKFLAARLKSGENNS